MKHNHPLGIHYKIAFSDLEKAILENAFLDYII